MGRQGANAALGVPKGEKMKHLIGLLIAAFAAMPAWAEWVRYSGDVDGTLYVDPAVRRKGNVVQFWSVVDRKERTKDGWLSQRSLMEIDCKEDRYRWLRVTQYSGPMATGEQLFDGDLAANWEDLPPGTWNATLHEIVCPR